MRQKIKISVKILAFALSFLMLITSLPIYAYASLIDTQSTESIEKAEPQSEVIVLEEDESLREENIKHFKLSDGTTKAVVYGQAVHYKDANGKWQDIDNSLTLNGSEYSSNSKSEIKLSNKSGSSGLISIKDGGYKIDLTPLNTNKVSVEIENPEENNSRKFDEIKKLSKLISKAKYSEIYNGVDLEYILIGNKIKENIIVKERQESYEYSFELKLSKLTATLEGNRITLSDSETGVKAYEIPVPYMYDANGSESYDVEYSLTQESNWKYTLTVKANADWVNTATLPVTIDPTIIAPTDSVMDTYTTINGSSHSTESILLVGNNGSYIRSYLKMLTLPTLPSGAVLTDGKLSVFSEQDITLEDFKVGAFKITDNWVDSTIQYDPNYDYITSGNPIDYVKISDSGIYTWNITDAVKGWYNGEANNGICLKILNGFTSVLATFSSSETTNWEPPYFEITYLDTKGIEDYYSYYTSTAGMAGFGYINSFTGNLSFIHNIFTTADEIMPYSLFLSYNSQTNAWNLSTNETISATAQEYQYKWTDSDGTEHWFSPEKQKNFYGSYVYYRYEEDGSKWFATDPPSEFYDEDGLGLNLELGTDGSFIMSDDSGNQKIFDSQGRLVTITDTYGNVRTFVRDANGNLTSITITPKNLSSIEQITVSYGTNSITVTNRQTGVVATVSYLNNTVQAIDYTYPDLNGDTSTSTYRVTFTYDSNGKLIFAKDEETEKGVRYTYTDGKVTELVEIAYDESNTEKTGHQARIIYSSKKTTYRTSGSDNINGNTDDILTVYVFDNKGRVITAYNCDANSQNVYGASNYVYNDKYEQENVGTKKHNSIKSVLESGKNSVNLLKNPNFDTDISNWTKFGQGTVSVQEPIYSTDLSVSDGEGVSISYSENGTTGIRQRVTLEEGYYNFSVSLSKYSSKEGSYLRLVLRDEYGNFITSSQPNIAYSVSNDTLKRSWEKESLSFNIETAGVYTLSIEYTTERISFISIVTSTIYIDDAMLEKTKGLGTFSAYENGEFEETSNFEKMNAEIVSGVGMLGTNGVKVDADVNGYGYLKYTHNVLNGFEPENWVISAWAKAPDSIAGVNDNKNDARFGIRIVSYYSGTSETEEIFIPFNSETKEWQYICQRLMISPDNEAISTTLNGGRLQKIEIYLWYGGNIGSAYFDSVSINRSGNYVNYTYNDLGNVTSTGNSNGETTTYEYGNGNATDVSGATDATGNQYSFEYDENHNLTGAVYGGAGEEFAEQVSVDYQRNDQGQALETTSTAKNLNKNIITSTSFITDTTKAYYSKPQVVTDELGNEIEYFYYSNGLLRGVCDSSNNGILYEYNDYGELICGKLAQRDSTGELVEATVNSTEIDYSYNSKHELGSISTESVKYSFKYDEWGNTIGIYIDNPQTTHTEYDTPLATYEYKDGYGELTKLTYGNGAYLEYIYDELDRIVGVCYNGIKKTEFVYASSGQTSSVIDISNNTSYQYYYDGDGKLINERVITDGSTTRNIFYKYDDKDRIYQKWTFFEDSEELPVTQITYTYNQDGSVASISQRNHTMNYTYDEFGRVTVKENEFTGGLSITEAYTYFFGEDWYNGTTSYISLVATTLPDGTIQNTFYTYDERGNISQITQGAYNLYYHYDEKNQLIREDNQKIGSTYVYTYDNAGNILSKATYAYTTSEALGSPVKTDTYTYFDASWKDKLTSYNGTSITYDSIGNPLTYYNGNSYSFTWEDGRKLSQAVKNGVTFNYEYNQDGIRISKEQQGYSRYEYEVEGTKILREREYLSSSGRLLADRRYFYDTNGIISSAKVYYYGYSGESVTEYDFYFRTNLQGDVLAVYNSSGTCLMEITYDAWGNFTDTVSTMEYPPSTEQLQALAIPFRYRGYYYDQETGLYYLNSRYYDASLGRFINSDGMIAGVTGELHGYNTFSYCFNNPVMMHDNAGNWPKWIEKIGEKIKETIVEKLKSISACIKIASEKTDMEIIDKAYEDVKSFDIHNTDEEKVLDANFFSVYNGVPVVKSDLLGNNAFSVGVVFMGNGTGNTAIDVKHEFGHSVQFAMLGCSEYMRKVAIPSITINCLDRLDKLPYSYYGAPFEAQADLLGGVTRNKNNTPWPSNAYNNYFDLIKMFW